MYACVVCTFVSSALIRMRKIQMRDRKKEKHVRTAILHLNKNDFGIFEKKHQSISTIAKRKTWIKKNHLRKLKEFRFVLHFFLLFLLYTNIYMVFPVRDCVSCFHVSFSLHKFYFHQTGFSLLVLSLWNWAMLLWFLFASLQYVWLACSFSR